MNAAILAISPAAPSLAFSLWLGSAGLSVCGLFVNISYPSVLDIGCGHGQSCARRERVPGETAVIATAIASPVIMALWSSVLFTIGIVDSIVQIPIGDGGALWKVIALIPIVFGALAVCVCRKSDFETYRNESEHSPSLSLIPSLKSCVEVQP